MVGNFGGSLPKVPQLQALLVFGAEGGIRTPTVLLPPAPQAGASASSATSATCEGGIRILLGRLLRRRRRLGRRLLRLRRSGRCRRARCRRPADDRSWTPLTDDRERHRADHEQRREHRRCLREHGGAGARAECRLAAPAAERGGHVALPLLQQDYEQQDQADHHIQSREQVIKYKHIRWLSSDRKPRLYSSAAAPEDDFGEVLHVEARAAD